jgi:hypothetical protein
MMAEAQDSTCRKHRDHGGDVLSRPKIHGIAACKVFALAAGIVE